MNNTIQRKKVYVSREIQGRILMRIVKYWFFYNVAVWHALLLIDFHRYGITGLLNNGPRFSLLEFYAEFAANHVALLVVAAAMSPFMLWDMLKLTHQIAGPLVRFRQTLGKMSRGEPVEKIKLRDGDLLIEFQESFNDFLASDQWSDRQPSQSSGETVLESRELDVLAAVAELSVELNNDSVELSSAAKTTAITT